MFFLPTWLLHTAKCFTKQKRKSYSHGFRALSKFHVSTVLWKINFSPIPFIYLRPTHSTRKKNMIRSNVVNLFRNALLNILYTVSEQVFNCVCDKFFSFVGPFVHLPNNEQDYCMGRLCINT